MLTIIGMSLALAVPGVTYAQGVLGKAAREAAEFAAKKFGREVVEEGAEKLAGRIASAAARHGDDAIHAVNRIGPKALSLADDAGENAPQVMRLLARHGDDAARVLGSPQGMALFARYGDDAAEIMMKHPGIGGSLAESLGHPAIAALKAVGSQNGRRLAMMAQGGELAAIGRSGELLEVIVRHGDKACEFIYRNRAVLAGSAALTAFLVNPEPFLDGTKDLAAIAVEGANDLVATVAESAVTPAVAAIGNTARQAISVTFWALAILAVAAVAGSAWAIRRRLHESPVVKAVAHAAWKRSGEIMAATLRKAR